MRLERHLVIFLRSPRLGRVKSRLAREIGAVAALGFYRRTVLGLLRRLGRDRRWRLWLAITPDGAARAARPWPEGAARLPQGGGDLGHRMARPMRLLPPGPVVLIGSDVPDIQPRHIARAFRLLGAADAVFGPARDGGYWLVGLRRRPRRLDPFRRVRWSSPHALADTLAHFGPRERVRMIETLEDIDDAADLARWRGRQKRLKTRI